MNHALAHLRRCFAPRSALLSLAVAATILATAAIAQADGGKPSPPGPAPSAGSPERGGGENGRPTSRAKDPGKGKKAKGKGKGASKRKRRTIPKKPPPPPRTWNYMVSLEGDATHTLTAPSGQTTVSTAHFAAPAAQAKLVRGAFGTGAISLSNCCASNEVTKAVTVTNHPATESCGAHVDTSMANGPMRLGLTIQGGLGPRAPHQLQVIFGYPPPDATATRVRTGWTCTYSGGTYTIEPFFDAESRPVAPMSCRAGDAEVALSGAPSALGQPFSLGVVCRTEESQPGGERAVNTVTAGLNFEPCPAPRGATSCRPGP